MSLGSSRPGRPRAGLSPPPAATPELPGEEGPGTVTCPSNSTVCSVVLTLWTDVFSMWCHQNQTQPELGPRVGVKQPPPSALHGVSFEMCARVATGFRA